MARLFIIGNGFDSAHSYPTKFKDFRLWCEDKLNNAGVNLNEVPEIPISSVGHHGEEVYDEEESLLFLMWLLTWESELRKDARWEQFEEYLHDLKLQDVFDEASQFSYANLENDPHDNELSHEQQDMEMYASALSSAVKQINVVFARWIRSVRLVNKRISFGETVIQNHGTGVAEEDLFFTFNYTETLEYVYGVPDIQICHIHGNRTKGDDLIIGHGNDSERGFRNRVTTAVDMLEEVIRSMRKDTSTIIDRNGDFWKKIFKADITEIYSFGFGYGDVDMPYIEKIVSLIGQDAIWYLNNYDSNKNIHFEQKIKAVGFKGMFGRY